MVGSGARAKLRCDALTRAPFSQATDMLYRSFLDPAHRATLDQLTIWMQDVGMQVRLDPAGNLVGRYEGAAPDAKTLIIASHIDSVRDAGAYDGPLGVMLGIEVVASLHAQSRRLPFAIDVIAFGDEEGSRFPASMLCSRAVAGKLDLTALDVTDRDGVALTSALTSFGLDPATFLAARRDPAELLGYIEAHIEQGPVLEAEGLALGVVTSIAAQRRYEVTVLGIAGHAGTNAMNLRRDALAASAEMILGIETIGRAGPEGLVATVGKLSVAPNATNVVPGKVIFTIDVRAGTDDVRNRAADEICARLTEIAASRDVSMQITLIHDLTAAPCDPLFVAGLESALTELGHTPRLLVSGAGHDAMAFSGVTPFGMLFVRCKGGISHNPLESVEPDDVEAALKVLLAFVDKLEAAL